jgi:hypothetical protein
VASDKEAGKSVCSLLLINNLLSFQQNELLGATAGLANSKLVFSQVTLLD